MSIGKINSALRVLDQSENAGILTINDENIKLLNEKHPKAKIADEDMILEGPINYVDSIIFENITGDLIKKISFNMRGSAGPSAMDADQWRMILGTKKYGQLSEDLANSIARMARILATETVTDRKGLSPYLACRLIPLDKNPGLRPIGIGETLRRITGKAVISVLRNDIQQCAGGIQLCAGQKGGCEAGIHAMGDLFNDDSSEGLIQVDASNAFNSINRALLLKNLKVLCPELATYGWNCYSTPSRLFITGGIEVSSEEGTTQGCPYSMPAYAIGILPLLSLVNNFFMSSQVKHGAYADDLSGVGKLDGLKVW